MSITPERIEEIKNMAAANWDAADNSRGKEAFLKIGVFELCDGISDLLEALEEEQVALGDKEGEITVPCTLTFAGKLPKRPRIGEEGETQP